MGDEEILNNESNKTEKENKFISLILLLLIITITLLILFILIYLYYPFYFTTGTEPEKVFLYTDGELKIKNREIITLEEFIGNLKEKEDSNYSIQKPLLEYDYSFYDSPKTQLEFCKSRKTQINFTEPKYSEFRFNYKNNSFSYRINLYKDLYLFSKYLKTQDCYFRKGEYSKGFLKDPYNNEFMQSVAQDFLELEKLNYSMDEIVEIITLFVQSIDYGTDKTNLNRYPYETLYKEQGNCLDKSIILVSILKELNYTIYFILGKTTREYHALVGIECEKGNIIHQGKEICFIETTIFTPISSDIEITIDSLVLISNGTRIYKDKYYGNNLAELFDTTNKKTNEIKKELKKHEEEFINLQEKMCQTDCAICDNYQVDFSKTNRLIRSCKDAKEFNTLISKYNSLIQEYNNKIKEWYTLYYKLEKSMFENIEIVKR